METKEFCGAARGSKVLKGKRGDSQWPLIDPENLGRISWRASFAYGLFVVSKAGAVYDASDQGSNEKFSVNPFAVQYVTDSHPCYTHDRL